MSNFGAPPRFDWYRRIGRLQLKLVVWCHEYDEGIPDRWVFQPSLVYDRAPGRQRRVVEAGAGRRQT